MNMELYMEKRGENKEGSFGSNKGLPGMLEREKNR